MIIAFIAGVAISYVILRFHKNGIIRKAEEDGELIKKNKLLEAKEKFMAMKEEKEKRLLQEKDRKKKKSKNKRKKKNKTEDEE